MGVLRECLARRRNGCDCEEPDLRPKLRDQGKPPNGVNVYTPLDDLSVRRLNPESH
jgi:hypothetical protein